jgi:ABC-type sulfate transport system substrate-binding protein
MITILTVKIKHYRDGAKKVLKPRINARGEWNSQKSYSPSVYDRAVQKATNMFPNGRICYVEDIAGGWKFWIEEKDYLTDEEIRIRHNHKGSDSSGEQDAGHRDLEKPEAGT